MTCVHFGSKRSVQYVLERRKQADMSDILSTREVVLFPFIASATLFSAYVIFRMFSKDYTNLLISFYFLIIGIAALFQAFRLLLRLLFSPIRMAPFAKSRYRLALSTVGDTQNSSASAQIEDCEADSSKFVLDDIKPRGLIKHVEFDIIDLVVFLLCVYFSMWNFTKKHWLANNVIALAISINAIEMLHLNKFSNGAILLSGLFVYDVFWVFGTNVMVSVAKSIEGPIKMVWPIDFANRTIWTHPEMYKNLPFAMLGLGDIVIPGIFIALLKRFDDIRSNEGSSPDRVRTMSYYRACFACYTLALFCTFVVMKFFNRAQPALLYIVPFCVIPICAISLINGDLPALLEYRDEPAAGSSDAHEHED